MFLVLGSMGDRKDTHSPSGLVMLDIVKSSANSTDDMPVVVYKGGREGGRVRGREGGRLRGREGGRLRGREGERVRGRVRG